MLLEEANTWLDEPITEEQLKNITPLYYVLDFLTKEDFCKVVNAVGVGRIIARKSRYDRLLEAEKQLSRKEQHVKDLKRYEEVIDEQEMLAERIGAYRSKHNL